jgi:cytochrome b
MLDALVARPAGQCVRVWDLPTRLFHWGLVAAVAVAAFTGFIGGITTDDVHVVAGTAIAVLIAFRLVWGMTGTTYARFRSFAFPPRVIWTHARDLLDARGHRHLGHNPLGGTMVFALLAVLAAIVATGAMALGGVLKQGPLAAFVGFDAGWSARGVHNLLAGLLLAMIGAHLAGVVFESWRGRERLVAAMVTGLKPADPPTEAVAPTKARPVRAAAIGLALGGLSLIAATVLMAQTVPGVSPPQLDRDYLDACGECHFAYPPVLAPAATWRGIMAGLRNHFGEDASLDAGTAARIGAWLEANSAEHWDTLPAHRLRVTDLADPLRITATPFWRHMHGYLRPEVFTAKQVGGKGQCSACHHDAARGMFAPQNIELPEELQ